MDLVLSFLLRRMHVRRVYSHELRMIPRGRVDGRDMRRVAELARPEDSGKIFGASARRSKMLCTATAKYFRGDWVCKYQGRWCEVRHFEAISVNKANSQRIDANSGFSRTRGEKKCVSRSDFAVDHEITNHEITNHEITNHTPFSIHLPI